MNADAASALKAEMAVIDDEADNGELRKQARARRYDEQRVVQVKYTVA